MESKKILTQDDNLIFLKFINETGIINLKEYIYNFLNEKPTKIKEKYSFLISEAIKKIVLKRLFQK
ncbi:hypothetical protein [Spiroplasma taiwanense]|uniref:Uncharacterized protein n=1 Tax=Spiroplasma taiwanense CT-1 TaxID=1276220 RepID=S5MB42_9MOLU|nr:hypothetical protein [Spiroplasma taiwanense]AGR40993.1 hypothetical protein STAIW_v1c03350 [Spiroplasma taiwanense CT-1]